jgi:hypothetical protein
VAGTTLIVADALPLNDLAIAISAENATFYQIRRCLGQRNCDPLCATCAAPVNPAWEMKI